MHVAGSSRLAAERWRRLGVLRRDRHHPGPLRGFCILTDPNFLHRGERVPLGYGLRSVRRTEPALSIDQLPAVDLIVLSHLHGDHFDSRAVRELDKRLPIITTDHAAKGLARKGFMATHPLALWDSHTVVKGSTFLRVTARRVLPAVRHR